MISAIIIAKNEEKNISEALKTVSFCDEAIVVDHRSNDKTAYIAKQQKASVYAFDEDDFSSLRNYGMKKAKGDWLLFIDADERISHELREEILSITQSAMSQYNTYALCRIDYFWGKKVTHGELAKAYHNGFIRLIKKGSGEWKGAVHEEFISQSPSGKLLHPLQHYPHSTVRDFLEDVNFYSTLRAEELLMQGRSNGPLEILFFPFFKFIYTYLIKLGFLDGAVGFVYSFMMSFHSFLVQSKLYLLNHKAETPSL